MARILTCPTCGEHFRLADDGRNGWETCPRCHSRFDSSRLSEAAGASEIGVTEQSDRRNNALGNSTASGDEEPKRTPTGNKTGVWLLAIIGSFGLSALLGLSAAILSAEVIGCCSPIALLLLVFIVGRSAWKEFRPTADDKASTGIVIVVMTCLFALALLIVFVSVCEAVAKPIKW